MTSILKTGLIMATLVTSACATASRETPPPAPPIAEKLPLAPTAQVLTPEPIIIEAPMPVTAEQPPAPLLIPAAPEPVSVAVVAAPIPVIISPPPAVIVPPSIAAAPKPKSVITIKASGLKTHKGVLSAALFDEAGYKSKDATPIEAQNIPVTGEHVSMTFKDLPAGEYGLKLYHDIDENGKLNTNVFGIPSEPYAFSNSALWPFGEAKWKDAKFTVGDGGVEQVITFK